MKPGSAFCLGFFGALAFYWIGVTSSGFDWTRHWKLARASSQVKAVVTRTEPSNHCSAHYEFEVNGERYYGSGAACGVSVGDKLRVYYLSGDPTFSTLKEPRSALVFVIVAPMVLSVIAGVVVMIRVSRPRQVNV